MPKYTVSCDLLIPLVLEIEAADEDAAIEALHARAPAELLKLANTENNCIGIAHDYASRAEPDDDDDYDDEPWSPPPSGREDFHSDG
jgi:hypothetical protein